MCRDGISPHIVTQCYNQMSNIQINIVNSNKKSLSTLDIRYIGYFYYVFPLHPNTFHRLFQHSTQPQLDELKDLISEFDDLKGCIIGESQSLCSLMVCLGWMSHVILAHILYLLASIHYFELIQKAYLRPVQVNLVGFMFKIRLMLLKSSIYLYDLMNILILHFCVFINIIFALIKAKLLYYLKLVQKQISIDSLYLSYDLLSMKSLLIELRSLLARYISILDKVKELLTKIKKLMSKIPILGTLVSVISPFNKILCKILCKFKTICSFCNNLNGIFGLLNKELLSIVADSQGGSINLKVTIKDRSEGRISASIMNINTSNTTNFKKSAESIRNIFQIKELSGIEVLNEIIPIVEQLLIMETINKSNSGVTVSPLKFHLKLIVDFQKYLDYIKKLLGIMQIVDLGISSELKSIVEQLDVLEPINLRKLYGLITQIQLKYLEILITEYLLICTILFYTEISPLIIGLNESMQFECSNVCGFLTKCSEVEVKCQCVSNKIHECIKKLAQAYNQYKSLGLHKEVLETYSHLIGKIVLLKFYVDLMAREILIFKMIIMNLILMFCSSQILDSLMFYIGSINGIDIAIKTLMSSHVYLKAFYFIQLQNTTTIVGLSSKLKFSKYINQYYGVLLFNLDLINRLMWAIECYIYHLIVFRYVTKGLNSLIENVAKQLQIVIDIYKVIISINNINNRLISINKSITELKKVGDGTDITNWKENQNKIRDQIKTLNSYISDINSELSLIKKLVQSVISLRTKLIWVYYYILILIIEVYLSILYTDYKYRSGIGIGNQYFFGLIMSVLGPCNKQLKFILGYLIVMSAFMNNLINIVKETIVLIYKNMGWLYGLATVLKDDVDKINKGAVGMECAIEGVARNFIKCTLLSLEKHVITSNDHDFLVNEVYALYSVINVMDYKVVVNRLLESSKKIDNIVNVMYRSYGCFCIESFEKNNGIDPKIGDLGIKQYFFRDKTSDYIYAMKNIEEMRNLYHLPIHGNHMCMCMVIKYVFNPQMLNLISVISYELDALSTISRKYTKYGLYTSVGSEVIKILIMILNLVHKICTYIESTYKSYFVVSPESGYLKCYCTYNHDKNYHLVVNTLLVISSLIENISMIHTDGIRMAIECLSNFSSELDIIDKDNNIGWNNCNPFIFRIVVNKYCCKNSGDQCDPKCCCVTCLIIILMSVYICISVKINNKLFPTKCALIKQRIGCFIKLLCKWKRVFKICGKLCNGKIEDCCPKLLQSCQQICGSSSQNNCSLDELLKNCVQKICGNQCCPGKPECICKQIKDCCEKLCDPFKNGDVDGVLKSLVEGCKTDGCKCSKCKIVSYAIKLMRKNMVLIECNMKHDIKFNSLTFGSITRTVLSNNIKILYLCRNELTISLFKNSSISHGTGSDNSTTDVKSVRNWGYDTRYEHNLTNSNSFIDVSNDINNGSG